MRYAYSLSIGEDLRRAVSREPGSPRNRQYIVDCQSESNRDRASEARHGGRFLTATFNRRLA